MQTRERTAVLVVVGLNQRNAAFADRELLAAPVREIETDLAGFLGGIDEVVVLSTRNRVELYATTRCPAAAVVALRQALNARAGHELPLFQLQGEEAFRHLVRVAASLESAILGEPEILAQVKDALDAALESGSAGAELANDVERALDAARRVRTETSIRRGGITWGHAAAALAEKVIGSLAGKRVVVVGGGETARLSAQHLHERGAAITMIDAPGAERAPALQDELRHADVVVSAARAAPDALRPAALARLSAERKRRTVVVDLAAPPAIPEESGRVRDVYLCDVDDLERVMHASLDEQAAAIAAAERIVDEEALRWARDEVRALLHQAGARPRRASGSGDDEAIEGGAKEIFALGVDRSSAA
jgi:glutamyl-tRNA reductase